MSIFYNAYFVKALMSIDDLKQKFSRVDVIEDSEWIVCNFGDSYFDGLFEPDDYLTLDISQQFGEVIFICLDTRNDQFEYEHSQAGNLLRKLSWLSDGCQSFWACVQGEKEEWEDDIIFTETESLRFLDYMKDDLTEEEFLEKQQKIRSICLEKEYLIDDVWPYVDATIAMSIQKFWQIKLPVLYEKIG